MIIHILAQAPDYSYHMPWYAKLRIGVIVVSLLIAAGKALSSGKPASARSTPSTPTPRSRKPVQHTESPMPPSRPAAFPVEAPRVPPILIYKDGQQHGPYTLDEIHGQLSAGAFALTDSAWHEDLSDWQPLSSIPGVNTGSMPARLPPPPPSHHLPVSSTPDTADATAPSSNGALIAGYICAAVSLLFLPPLLGLVGIICGVVVIKRQEVNKGVTLLIVSFVCAALAMMIGAAP